MERRLDIVDLIAAVGLFATIVGGGLFYMAANDELTAGSPDPVVETSATVIAPAVGQQWVQPALGQALIDNYLVDWAFVQAMRAAAKELNHASLVSQYWSMDSDLSSTHVMNRVTEMDRDHAARLQYVLGRAIVQFSERGIRSGALSALTIEGTYNRRMIEATERRANDLDTAYRESREPSIGRMIVTEASEAVQGHERIQGRLGAAITRMAMLQEDHQAKGRAQTQLALVAVAALHAEQVADRFEMLANAEESLRPTALVSVGAYKAWPDISGGLLMAGSIVLIGLFCSGLMMPGTRPVERPAPRDVPAARVYRKTA